jgi:hypothetical protein
VSKFQGLQYSLAKLKVLEVANEYGAKRANYLEHNGTDVINALSDCFSSSGYSDRPFRGIGQHFGSDLDRRPRHFSNFFYFGPSFAD